MITQYPRIPYSIKECAFLLAYKENRIRQNIDDDIETHREFKKRFTRRVNARALRRRFIEELVKCGTSWEELKESGISALVEGRMKPGLYEEIQVQCTQLMENSKKTPAPAPSMTAQKLQNMSRSVRGSDARVNREDSSAAHGKAPAQLSPRTNEDTIASRQLAGSELDVSRSNPNSNESAGVQISQKMAAAEFSTYQDRVSGDKTSSGATCDLDDSEEESSDKETQEDAGIEDRSSPPSSKPQTGSEAAKTKRAKSPAPINPEATTSKSARRKGDASQHRVTTQLRRQNEELNERLKFQAELFDEIIPYIQGLSVEAMDTVMKVFRNLRFEGSSAKIMADDLLSTKRRSNEQQTLLRKLQGERTSVADNSFPKIPAQKANSAYASASAGYMGHVVENIAYGRLTDRDVSLCIQGLRKELEVPQVQRAIMGAFLCRWIFQSPEPMYAEQHSLGTMMLYELEKNTNKLECVRQLDKLCAKLLWENQSFREKSILPREKALQEKFSKVIDKVRGSGYAPGSGRRHEVWSSTEFASKAMELKQQLLLSPHDYRLYYSRPGCDFDPSWMSAYDETNQPVDDAEAADQDVQLCLFPALIEQEAKLGDLASEEDVLVKNKRFLPDWKEVGAIDVKAPVCKAAVLVLHKNSNDGAGSSTTRVVPNTAT
ncbi:hypothetical protein OPT61_g6671 [Boeremia exigua]|uniref:Uncharacterized protein n=1 Tax=Boeremia exigua TaxID=749465 RepID=A0ACC2I5E7_9PLEO|nr:hypothetical protein OPT61_g6671 [Boeremia exigua]